LVDNEDMLEQELQRIYDSEINIRIGWLWDGGIDVRLGDDMNGYLAEENVRSMAEILPWLQEAIAHFYPDSTYPQSLPQEIRDRASRRLFLPPTTGMQVLCPHCVAPHAAPPGMEELFAFVCPRCGESVEVPRPEVTEGSYLFTAQPLRSDLSFSLASATVCHCMFAGSSLPPQASGLM
jgi:hypothetical protein